MCNLTIESILNFGKYKGKKVDYVLQKEPSYIYWMIKQNIATFENKVIVELIDNLKDDDDDSDDRYQNDLSIISGY